MLIVLGLILFGFCLAGWKFLGRLVCVVLFFIAIGFILLMASGIF